MIKKFFCMLFLIFSSLPKPLFSEEGANEVKSQEILEKETAEKREKESQGKKKRVVTLSEENEEVREEQVVEEKKLANPEIINRYLSAREANLNFGELLFLNIFVGSFSGAVFGALGSLSVYDSQSQDQVKSNLLLFSGAGAAVGALAGFGVTLNEYSRKRQLVVGPVLMNYSWYGAFGGTLAGMAAGLIPYASSKNTDDILNFGGYGAMAGVVFGVVLFFWQYPENIQPYLSFSSESFYARLATFF